MIFSRGRPRKDSMAELAQAIRNSRSTTATASGMAKNIFSQSKLLGFNLFSNGWKIRPFTGIRIQLSETPLIIFSTLFDRRQGNIDATL